MITATWCTVTLPDDTTRSYHYQHATQAVTNGTVAPIPRTSSSRKTNRMAGPCINAYDSQRRVTNQLSTAGSESEPHSHGHVYLLRTISTSPILTPTRISGYTLIIDGNNHTNRYDYTNSLITKITDPLGQTIQQTWYPDNATAPGYPRSCSQTH